MNAKIIKHTLERIQAMINQLDEELKENECPGLPVAKAVRGHLPYAAAHIIQAIEETEHAELVQRNLNEANKAYNGTQNTEGK